MGYLTTSRIKTLEKRKNNFAVAGDRTRVTRVTGGNTYHYTMTIKPETVLIDKVTQTTWDDKSF